MNFKKWYAQLLIHASQEKHEHPMQVCLSADVAVEHYKRGHAPALAFSMMQNPDIQSGGISAGAKFDEGRRYRYQLWRIWDRGKPFVTFIGLNPSTADEAENDPTIRVVTGYARRWGMGGVFMVNCFPYISTNPADLIENGNDQLNNTYIQSAVNQSSRVIFAWGAFKIVKRTGRGEELANLYPQAEALRINADGSPHHPLYLPADIKPVFFNQKQFARVE